MYIQRSQIIAMATVLDLFVQCLHRCGIIVLFENGTSIDYAVTWNVVYPDNFPPYQSGPPEGMEMFQLVKSLMPLLEDNWLILGDCLAVPAYEIATAKTDEPSLYRKIRYLLDYWVGADRQNDRCRLVNILFDTSCNLANAVSQSLEKV